MKKYIIGALLIAGLTPLDQYTKMLIVDNLSDGSRLSYLGGFLKIVLVYNRGGVFGIFQGYKNVFLILSIVVLILMIAYFVYEKHKTMPFTIAMALIVSGAVGNIIDRLIPGREGVVDFISVGINQYRWPAFNVADSSIVVGAALLIIAFILEEKRRKSAEENALPLD